MTAVSDSFNRANNTSLGADWAEDSGDWGIASNRLQQGTAGSNYRKVRWVGAPLASANYYVEAVVYTGNNGAIGTGVFGRGASDGAVTYIALEGFPGDRFYIVQIVGGVETILATSAATCAANTAYTLRLRADGNTLQGLINGVLDANLQVTISPSANVAVGAMSYGLSSGGGAYIDDWAAADLAVTSHDADGAGAIGLSGAATLTVSVSANGAGALGIVGAGQLASEMAADGAGALGIMGAATAQVDVTAYGQGFLGLTGGGVGVVDVSLAAEGVLGLLGAATASVGVSASGAGAIGLAGAAEGVVAWPNWQADGAGMLGIVGVGAAVVEVRGNGAGAIGLVGGAEAAADVSATGVGVIGLVGVATATAPRPAGIVTLYLLANAAVAVAGHGAGALGIRPTARAAVEVVANGAGAIGLGGRDALAWFGDVVVARGSGVVIQAGGRLPEDE